MINFRYHCSSDNGIDGNTSIIQRLFETEEQTILFIDKEALYSSEKLIEKSREFKFLKDIPQDLIQIKINKYYYCWLDVLKERFKLEDFIEDLS